MTAEAPGAPTEDAAQTSSKSRRRVLREIDDLVILLRRAEGDFEDVTEKRARDLISLYLAHEEQVRPLQEEALELQEQMFRELGEAEGQVSSWKLRPVRRRIRALEGMTLLQIHQAHLEELRLANRLAFVNSRDQHRYAAALNRATRLLVVATLGLIFVAALQLAFTLGLVPR